MAYLNLWGVPTITEVAGCGPGCGGGAGRLFVEGVGKD